MPVLVPLKGQPHALIHTIALTPMQNHVIIQARSYLTHQHLSSLTLYVRFRGAECVKPDNKGAVRHVNALL
jgi:hypothetical protein